MASGGETLAPRVLVTQCEYIFDSYSVRGRRVVTPGNVSADTFPGQCISQSATVIQPGRIGDTNGRTGIAV